MAKLYAVESVISSRSIVRSIMKKNLHDLFEYVSDELSRFHAYVILEKWSDLIDFEDFNSALSDRKVIASYDDEANIANYIIREYCSNNLLSVMQDPWAEEGDYATKQGDFCAKIQ